ncbi:hypothetical protein B7494_g2147 [Chlorociboria aeruginascens]|nr:hypothetical protein B7494_g2147 [Chlorociboria aeruginascens]
MDYMEASLPRGFSPIKVKTFTQQYHTDRNSETPQIFEEPLPSNVETISELPRPAPWRLNLVALSQKHNLYFAAYRQYIHVIIPRGMNRTLPGKPSLIINLPRSDKALKIGGYVNPHAPHLVNHIVVGNLGNKEILLIACDDGDVIGYYTDLIHKSVHSSPRLPERLVHISTLQPFFHENVNLSAWGLAIHEQTRLIAVSSNRREVTVFVHATNSLHESLTNDEEWIETRWESTAHKVEKFPFLSKEHQLKEAALCKDSICRGEGFLQNLRLVINLGDEGHNIPSIAFASDARGMAESIVATDINGNLVIKPFPLFCGWGALVLPMQYFKRTQSAEEALGVPLPRTFGVFYNKGLMAHFDISCSRSDIWPIESNHLEPDNPGLVMEPLRSESMEPTTPGENESTEGSDDLESGEESDDSQSAQDIELIGPTTKSPGTICRNAIKTNPRPLQFRGLDRICYLSFVPELSLVLVATGLGRVALLTITRQEDSFSQYGPVLTFRLDITLPPDGSLEGGCPLMGMAVAPCRDRAFEMGVQRVGTRRWNLILHYMDNMVLTYELSRDEESGGVLIW